MLGARSSKYGIDAFGSNCSLLICMLVKIMALSVSIKPYISHHCLCVAASWGLSHLPVAVFRNRSPRATVRLVCDHCANSALGNSAEEIVRCFFVCACRCL